MQRTYTKLKLLFIMLLAAMLSACIFVPKEVHYYDEGCDIYARKVTLTHQQMDSALKCTDEQCVGQLLLLATVVPAASLIISGSIVIAGNTVYWLEKQADCFNKNDIKAKQNT